MASNPNAALPANRSNIVASSNLDARILKSDSFTLSNVGRVFLPSSVYSFVPSRFSRYNSHNPFLIYIIYFMINLP